MSDQNIKLSGGSSKKELSIRENFFRLFEECPIPNNELLSNLGLFIKRQDLSRILFMNELYKKIIDVNGIVIEFGVRWGQNLALFETFRGMYEPYNYNRKIIGFDTFEGFPSVHEKNGKSDVISKGSYSVTEKYEEYLNQILDYHEQESPIPHIKKHLLIKGDATVEFKKYLDDNPETIVALAYFDFDLYEPTRACLELIMDHVTRGSVIGFDELSFHEFPGETIALKEVLGLKKYKITRWPYTPLESYIVIDELK
ncbi:MAG: crotonobetainyl-CoA--carnitine CoA-transferase [Promethearchaeota archaeon]